MPAQNTVWVSFFLSTSQSAVTTSKLAAAPLDLFPTTYKLEEWQSPAPAK